MAAQVHFGLKLLLLIIEPNQIYILKQPKYSISNNTMVNNRMLITDWTLAKDEAGTTVLRGYGVTKDDGCSTLNQTMSRAWNLCMVSIYGIAIPAHIVSTPGDENIASIDTIPGIIDVSRISRTLTCCRFTSLDALKAIQALNNVHVFISKDGILLGAHLVNEDPDSLYKLLRIERPSSIVANISFVSDVSHEGIETVGGDEFVKFNVDYKKVNLEWRSQSIDLTGIYDDDILTRNGEYRVRPANCVEYEEMPMPRNNIVRSWCADWYCESIGWNYSFVTRRSKCAVVYNWRYPRNGLALGHGLTENLEDAVVNVVDQSNGMLPQCVVNFADISNDYSALKAMCTVEYNLPNRLLRWLYMRGN